MHNNLQNAKAYLRTHSCTCVLCRGEELYSSTQRGVRPLLDFLDSGKNFTGFCAADKVVGKATAHLYCLLGVEEVYAQVLSTAAMQVLTKQGIRVSWGTLVEEIRNRDNTGPCPMEHATKHSRCHSDALAIIRDTLKAMQ